MYILLSENLKYFPSEMSTHKQVGHRHEKRVPTIYVLYRNMKIIRVFLFENFQFLEVKFSIYLNRRVFVNTKMCLLQLIGLQRNAMLCG